MRLNTFNIVGMMVFLFGAPPVFADYLCDLSAAPANPDAFMGSVTKEIQEGCSALEIHEMDFQKAEKKALINCCKKSNTFLKENAPPCAPQSDDSKLRYMLKLAFAVCDQISSGKLEYERNQCFERMNFQIENELKDARVKRIEDDCLAVAHKVQNEDRQSMGDEADAECQHSHFKKLLKQLPPEVASCGGKQVTDDPASQKKAESPGTPPPPVGVSATVGK